MAQQRLVPSPRPVMGIPKQRMRQPDEQLLARLLEKIQAAMVDMRARDVTAPTQFRQLALTDDFVFDLQTVKDKNGRFIFAADIQFGQIHPRFMLYGMKLAREDGTWFLYVPAPLRGLDYL